MSILHSHYHPPRGGRARRTEDPMDGVIGAMDAVFRDSLAWVLGNLLWPEDADGTVRCFPPPTGCGNPIAASHAYECPTAQHLRALGVRVLQRSTETIVPSLFVDAYANRPGGVESIEVAVLYLDLSNGPHLVVRGINADGSIGRSVCSINLRYLPGSLADAIQTFARHVLASPVAPPEPSMLTRDRSPSDHS